MSKSHLLYLTVWLIIVMLISPISALAVEEQITHGQRLPIKAQETRRQESEDKKVEFCNRANAGLTERLNKFAANQTLMMKFYSQIQTALQTLITNRQTKGESTTELKSYQTQLDTKISALATATTTYQQALAQLQTINCTQDREAFGTALRASNQAMQALNRTRQDLHTFVRTKLYPVVNKMRLRSLTPTARQGDSL